MFFDNGFSYGTPQPDFSGGSSFPTQGAPGGDGIGAYLASQPSGGPTYVVGNTIFGPRGVTQVVDTGGSQMFFGPDGAHLYLRNANGGMYF